MALKEKLAELIVDINAKLSPLKGQLAKANAMLKRGFATMARMATRAAKYIGVALVAALAWATKAAMVQEDAEHDLAAALELTGDATEKNIKNFKKFASAIQEVTTFGDEFTLSLMAQLKILGVSTSRLKEATKVTLGLMTSTGRAGQTMIMATAALMAGDTELLTRYIPALRMTTSKTEKMRLAMKLASDGFIVAKERAKTTSGRLKQLRNTIGDLAEKIGSALLPGLEKAIKWMKQWVDTNAVFVAQKVDEYVGKIAVGLEKIKGPAKTVATHWGKIWKTTAVFIGLALGAKLIGIGKAAWVATKAIGAVALGFGRMVKAAVLWQTVAAAGLKGLGGAGTVIYWKLLSISTKVVRTIKGMVSWMMKFAGATSVVRTAFVATAKAVTVVSVQIAAIAAGIGFIVWQTGKWVGTLWKLVAAKKAARKLDKMSIKERVAAYKEEHKAALKVAAIKREARRGAEQAAKEELASLRANLDELRAGEKVEEATDASRKKALEEQAKLAKKEAKRKFNIEIKGLNEWRKTAGHLAKELFDVKVQLAREALQIDLRNIETAKKADLQSIEDTKTARLKDLAEKEQEVKDEHKEKRDTLIDLYTDAKGFEKQLDKLRKEQREEEAADIAKQTGLQKDFVADILASKKDIVPEDAAEIARSGLVGLQAAWGQIATGTKRTEEAQLRALERIVTSTERQEEIAESDAGMQVTGTPNY